MKLKYNLLLGDITVKPLCAQGLMLRAKQASWLLLSWTPSTPWWFPYAVCAGSLPLRQHEESFISNEGSSCASSFSLVYRSSQLVLLLHIKIFLMIEPRKIMSWQQKKAVITALVTFMVLCQLFGLDWNGLVPFFCNCHFVSLPPMGFGWK